MNYIKFRKNSNVVNNSRIKVIYLDEESSQKYVDKKGVSKLDLFKQIKYKQISQD